MTGNNQDRATFDEAIETIESGYEYLLAYAAQGRRSDRGAGAESGPRSRLDAMASAMEGLPAAARAVAAAANAAACSDFLATLERDVVSSLSAIRLVLAQTDISSQLVDNLNASIHLRAVLTDIFLLDEVL